MGTNFGKIIYDATTKAFSRVENQELASLVSSNQLSSLVTHSGEVICKAIGLMAVHFFQSAAPIFTACSLGSQLVCESVTSIIDPLIERYNVPIPLFKNNPKMMSVAQISLCTLGCRSQILKKGLSNMSVL